MLNKPVRLTSSRNASFSLSLSLSLSLVLSLQCDLHWQEQGNFLCVQVARSTGKSKKITTNLELFRIREKSMLFTFLNCTP